MLSKLCSSPGDTTFHLNGTNGDTLKDLKKAKNDCAQACDDKPECKYASLFWIDNTIEEWIQVQIKSDKSGWRALTQHNLGCVSSVLSFN